MSRAEETPVTLLRNSERKLYRRCRLAWKWKYLDHLSTPRPRGALTFGHGIHYALELYYPPGTERGPHPSDTFATWYAENDHKFDQWDDEGNRHEALELGCTMLSAYVDEYGAEDHINILVPEMPMRVDIFDKQGRYLATWVGRMDSLYEDLSMSSRRRRRIGFFEHKSAKQIEHNMRPNSGYGEQGLGYAWAGSQFLRQEGILKDGENVDHVLFNWLRKGLPDERVKDQNGYALNKPSKDALLEYASSKGIALPSRPKVADIAAAIDATGFDHRLLGEPSSRQPSPLFERYPMDYGDAEMNATAWRIAAEAWEREQLKAGKLPLYKNPTKDCSWDCEFVEACELHEMGGDFQSVLDLEFEQWDPYEDHEQELK